MKSNGISKNDLLRKKTSSKGTESFSDLLKQWRQRLSYFSIFAAIPAVIAGNSQDARAEDTVPPTTTIAERENGLSGRQQRRRVKPAFLRQAGDNRLPYQKGSSEIFSSPLGGGDDCPGTPIRPGVYTAAAPFVDSGNTSGANNTVGALANYYFLYYYYYYYDLAAQGPDQIYSFTLRSLGANPQIRVTSESPNYHPLIYLLQGGCPSGINNRQFNYLSPAVQGESTATIALDGNTPLNTPLHLFIDAAAGGVSGPYNLRVQDLRVKGASTADFDADGKTDIAVWRSSDSIWYIIESNTGQLRFFHWGEVGDALVPADFDGDSKADPAVFRASDSNWYVINSLTNTISVVRWGVPGDMPVVADYTGDQKADFAIYRPSEGTWYVRGSDGRFRTYHWGEAGDIPAPADFNGDGVTELTIFRPSEGRWYSINPVDNSINVSSLQWGVNGDVPVAGDYSGDGKADFAVYRPSEGKWYRFYTDTFTQHVTTLGVDGDVIAPGDYDRDGKQDLAVFRPSEGKWYILGSAAGLFEVRFGQSGDTPVPSAFVR